MRRQDKIINNDSLMKSSSSQSQGPIPLDQNLDYFVVSNNLRSLIAQHRGTIQDIENEERLYVIAWNLRASQNLNEIQLNALEAEKFEIACAFANKKKDLLDKITRLEENLIDNNLIFDQVLATQRQAVAGPRTEQNSSINDIAEYWDNLSDFREEVVSIYLTQNEEIDAIEGVLLAQNDMIVANEALNLEFLENYFLIILEKKAKIAKILAENASNAPSSNFLHDNFWNFGLCFGILMGCGLCFFMYKNWNSGINTIDVAKEVQKIETNDSLLKLALEKIEILNKKVIDQQKLKLLEDENSKLRLYLTYLLGSGGFVSLLLLKWLKK